MGDNRVITLTTDFGYRDPFAGVLKGVVLGINPMATIIDLTHGIRPHRVAEAAFIIGMNYQYFPKGSIHVAVVDPGVGSARRPILVEADHHYFVGPDNGIFSYIFGMGHEILRVIHITASHYFLSSHSPTFQGRDVFAPVAAWLSKGVDMSKFGEPISDYRRIAIPLRAVSKDGIVEGDVILIDGFGNAITNITESEIGEAFAASPESHAGIFLRETEIPLKKYYSEAESGKLCALLNSSGRLEIFVNRGSASSDYKISPGDKVRLVPVRSS